MRAPTSGGPYSVVSTGLVTSSFTDTGLLPNTTYYYVVQGVNGNGAGPNSNPAFATTPSGIAAAPTALTATPASSTLITLSWMASTGAASHNILRSVTSGGGYATVASNVSATTYNDLGLSPSTTYYYVVQAVNAFGISPNSNQASATTQTPTTLSLTESDIGSLTPAGSASYASGVYTVNTGNGLKLTNLSATDSFSFDAQPVNGDFTLTARVVSLTCNDAAKCEGVVMIREILNNNSAFAATGGTLAEAFSSTTVGPLVLPVLASRERTTSLPTGCDHAGRQRDHLLCLDGRKYLDARGQPGDDHDGLIDIRRPWCGKPWRHGLRLVRQRLPGTRHTIAVADT